MSKRLNIDLSVRADTSQAKQNILDLKNALNSISTIKAPSGLELNQQMKTAVQSAKDLEIHLSKAYNVKTGNFDLKKLNSSLKQSGQNLADLSSNLLATGPKGEEAFLKIQKAIANSNIQLTKTRGLMSEFATTLKNTARWQLSSNIIHGLQSALSSAVRYAKDLDKSLNNIQIVTGYSADKMAEFAVQASKAARSLSTTTTKYTDAALIYYQQGLSDKDVADRADITIKMANVSRQSATTVSDQMTAIWNNFYNGSKSLEYYADVLTALGAATASSSDEIAQGLEKFSAIAQTVGLSYEYATAALATLTAETRQSADVVGTSLKTLFARLQGLQLGDTLEDGVTLNKYSSALKTVGVEVLDASGNLREMDDILDDLGEKWQNLTSAQKTATAQTVAGVRQYNQLISLMDNWDIFKQNLNIAETSEGSLQSQQDIYTDSIEAIGKRISAALEDIGNDLIPTDFAKELMKALESILSLTDSIVEGMGGLPNILLMVASILTKKIGPEMTQAFGRVGNFVTQRGHEAVSNIKAFRENPRGTMSNAWNYIKNAPARNRDLGLGNIFVEGKDGFDYDKTIEKSFENWKNFETGASEVSKKIVGMGRDAIDRTPHNETFVEYQKTLQVANNLQANLEKIGGKLSSQQKQRLADLNEELQAVASIVKERKDELKVLKNNSKNLYTSMVTGKELKTRTHYNQMGVKEFKNFQGDLAKSGINDIVEVLRQAAGQVKYKDSVGVEFRNKDLTLINAAKDPRLSVSNSAIAEFQLLAEHFKSIFGAVTTEAHKVITENEFKNLKPESQESYINDQARKIKESYGKLGLSQEAEAFQSVLNGQDGSLNKLKAITQEYEKIQSRARGLSQITGTENQTLDQIEQSSVEIARKETEINTTISQRTGILDKVKQEYKNIAKSQGGFAQGLSSGVQMATQVSFAVSSVSNAIDILKQDSVELVPALTAVTMAISSIYSVIQMIMAHPYVALILGALALITGAIVGIAKAADKSKYTTEEALKNAKKATDELALSADEAKNAFEELGSTKDKLDELYNTLVKCKKGTEEWAEAAGNLRDAINQFVQDNPELLGRKDLFIVDKTTGELILNPEVLEAVEKEKSAEKDKKNFSANLASARAIQLENKNKLENKTNYNALPSVYKSYVNRVLQGETVDTLELYNKIINTDGFDANNNTHIKQLNDLVSTINAYQTATSNLGVLWNKDFQLGDDYTELEQVAITENLGKEIAAKTAEVVNEIETTSSGRRKQYLEAVAKEFSNDYCFDSDNKLKLKSDDSEVNNETAAALYMSTQIAQQELLKSLDLNSLKFNRASLYAYWDQQIENSLQERPFTQSDVASFSSKETQDVVKNIIDRLATDTAIGQNKLFNKTYDEYRAVLFDQMTRTFDKQTFGSSNDILELLNDQNGYFTGLPNEVREQIATELYEFGRLNYYDENLSASLNLQSQEIIDEIYRKNDLEEKGYNLDTAQFLARYEDLTQAALGGKLSLQGFDIASADAADSLYKLAESNKDLEASALAAANALSKIKAINLSGADQAGEKASVFSKYAGKNSGEYEITEKEYDILFGALSADDVKGTLIAADGSYYYIPNEKSGEALSKAVKEYTNQANNNLGNLSYLFSPPTTTKREYPTDESGLLILPPLGSDPIFSTKVISPSSQSYRDAFVDIFGEEEAAKYFDASGNIIDKNGNILPDGENYQKRLDEIKGLIFFQALSSVANAVENGILTKNDSGLYVDANGNAYDDFYSGLIDEELERRRIERQLATRKEAEKLNIKDSWQVVDAYASINDEIKEYEKNLKRAEDVAKSVFGNEVKMAEAYSQVLDQINKKEDLLENKRTLANTEIRKSQDVLNALLRENGISFDEQNGDYYQLLNEIELKKIAAEEQYKNALLNNSGDKDTLETEENKRDTAIRNYEKLSEAVNHLIKDQETLDEVEEELYQNQKHRIETQYQQILDYYDLIADENERQSKLLEYQIGGLEDDYYSISESMALASSKRLDLEENLNAARVARNKIEEEHRKNIEKGIEDEAQYRQNLRENEEAVLSQLEALRDLDEQMKKYYSDALDKANKELEEFTSSLEHSSKILDHIENVYGLLGKDTDYNAMTNFFASQISVLEDTLKASTETYETFLGEYRALVASDADKDMIEAAKKALDKAELEMLNSSKDLIEGMKQQYENSIKSLGQTIEEYFTNELGYDYMLEMMGLHNDLQEKFLTTTNKIYETNKLINDAQKDINDSTNEGAKDKLRAFQNEMKQLQARENVSKTDLNIAQASFDLLKARIALEEAQNNKHKLSLQRNAAGNYDYVYTADTEKILEAEQKLADAENKQYNTIREATVDARNELLQMQNDALKKITEALIEGDADKAMDLLNEYADIMPEIEKEAMDLTGQLKELAPDDALELYPVVKGTDEFVSSLKDLIDKGRVEFEVYNAETERLTSNVTDLMAQAVQQAEDSAQGLLIAMPEIEQELVDIRDLTIEWLQTTSEGLEELIASAETLLGIAAKGTTTISGNTASSATTSKKEINVFAPRVEHYTPGTSTSKNFDLDYEDRLAAWYASGQNGPMPFSSGGYTGEWGPAGKLAILHEKELVLNKQDTKNFLTGLDIFKNIITKIEEQAFSLPRRNLDIFTNSTRGSGNTIEQKVSIEAHFPGVTSAIEIERALTGIVNDAAQMASINQN